MKDLIKKLVRRTAHGLGYEIVRLQDTMLDATAEDREIATRVAPYTVTSAHAVQTLIAAVDYVVARKIPGSVVECGVGKGGSVMAAALKLSAMGEQNRDIYLFDTFTGMTEPGDEDFSYRGEPAAQQYNRQQTDDGTTDWCHGPLDQVIKNVSSTGYDRERLHYVEGKVEDTIPAHAPEQIAILRLDTDWYQSTRHELVHLYPRLSAGGVLIIDDYGYWQGARKAVDEYIDENDLKLFLHKIDHSSRITVKI
ncbi:MAG TPA: macrocin O-methyltransferase [Sneathiellales bacterium]|jgi:hypothetical protein|nr:macrocin O-methyltransferase [Sneathiellales bacterium]